MSPAFDLQGAVHAALIASVPLVSLLGGSDRIHDRAPERRHFPYLLHGRTAIAAWNTASEAGHEHFLVIEGWSRERGRAESLQIIEAVEAALVPSAIALTAHRLVNLTLDYTECRYEQADRAFKASLRFRAVTEPLG